MRKLLIRGELKLASEATVVVVVKNTSGGDLVEGDVVVLDPDDCTSTIVAIETTNSDDDLDVYGMLAEDISSDKYGRCLRSGLTDKLKVNGSDPISVGDKISTYSTAKLGAKATTGKGGVFAIALEGWSGGDGGVIDAILFEPGRFDSTSGGNSLDSAYDQGSGGGGRTITVDNNAVVLAGDESLNNILVITNTAGSGALIDLANTTTGSPDIDGTGSSWHVTGDGVATFDSLASVGVVKFASDALGGDTTHIGYSSNDLIINTVSGESIDLQVAQTNVVTITGSAITLAQATTISAGGLTVSAGGVTVTGSSTIAGNLYVDGDLTWSGATTLAHTMTVDELILDPDGTAPVATNAYIVRDNGGDLTLNCYTGKQVIFAVAGGDIVTISATVIDINGKELMLDANADTSIHADSDDQIDFNLSGSDDFSMTVNSFNILTGSVLNLADSCHLQFGANDDIVMLHSGVLASDTTLADVVVGTPKTLAVTADSLIISNHTSNGDIAIVVNKGGHSFTAFHAAGTTGDVTINAATGQSVDIAIDTTDEYEFSAASLDMKENHLDNCGYIVLNSCTWGTGQTGIWNENSGDLVLNAITGKQIEFEVADTNVLTLDATSVIIASGDNLQFGGNQGIIDSTGNELIQFTATGSAVNYLQVINAAAADPIILQCLGTVDRGFMFEAVGALEIMSLSSATSAVAYLDILNCADGGQVALAVKTSVTNAGLTLDTAGSGMIVLAYGGVDALAIKGAAISLAADGNTAGQALYMQTEDGGTATSSVGKAGGAWEMRTGDGTAGHTGSNGGGAGGAMSLVTGAGLTGLVTGDGGAGGAMSITSGVGGICGEGAADSGDGGIVTLVAGAGGEAGNNASATGGDGGCVMLTAGAAGGASGGTAGKAGVIRNMSPVVFERAQTALTDGTTLTAAQLLSGIIDGTPTGAANYEMPAAAALVAEIPSCQIGDTFMFFINNKDGSATITVTAGGASLDGTITVSPNVIRPFLVVITGIGAASYLVYGMGD